MGLYKKADIILDHNDIGCIVEIRYYPNELDDTVYRTEDFRVVREYNQLSAYTMIDKMVKLRGIKKNKIYFISDIELFLSRIE